MDEEKNWTMEGSSVANIAGRAGGSVLVLGASPRLGYENSFTGNEFYSQRGKTAPPDWPQTLQRPHSTADRLLQTRHSRSCLTRVCQPIVTACSSGLTSLGQRPRARSKTLLFSTRRLPAPRLNSQENISPLFSSSINKKNTC